MSAELSREWLKKADEDYEAAVLLNRKRKPPLLNSICFHCQQSCEKYLKAYLALYGIDFPKTHDLVLLNNLCAKRDGEFEFLSDLAISLNPYSVEFRYPGGQANRRDAKRALICAQEIRDFMQRKIKRNKNG